MVLELPRLQLVTRAKLGWYSKLANHFGQSEWHWSHNTELHLVPFYPNFKYVYRQYDTIMYNKKYKLSDRYVYSCYYNYVIQMTLHSTVHSLSSNVVSFRPVRSRTGIPWLISFGIRNVCRRLAAGHHQSLAMTRDLDSRIRLLRTATAVKRPIQSSSVSYEACHAWKSWIASFSVFRLIDTRRKTAEQF